MASSQEPKRANRAKTALTVVICTHNRLSLLRRTLDYLKQTTVPDGLSVRVLVVANACTDGTVNWLASGTPEGETGQLPVDWIEESTPGKSYALNRAIGRVDTAYMAFVDDDHRVSVDYLTVLARAIADYPEVNLLCGRILPDWDGSEPAWVHDEGRYRIYPLPVPRFDLGGEPTRINDDTPIPGGGNLVLRSSVFERLGSFLVELGPRGHDLGGSEDTEFVLRALESGEVIQYIPELLQHHYVDLQRLRLPYLLRKSFQRSRSIIRVKRKDQKGIPRYLWRKAVTYLFQALLSASWTRSRFYLVRLAGILGEMRGSREELPAPTRPVRGELAD